MADTVEMKATPPFEDIDTVEFLYDGELIVQGGRAYVPADRVDWQGRMLMNGYRFVSDADRELYIERTGIATD
jgi:hypothetical protein